MKKGFALLLAAVLIRWQLVLQTGASDCYLPEIWNSDKIYPTKARPRTLFVRKTQSYLEYSSIKCYHIIA